MGMKNLLSVGGDFKIYYSNLKLAIIFIKVPPQQNEHIEFKFAFKKNVISTIVAVRSKIHKNYQHTV